MKAALTGIILAVIILAFIPCLPSMAASNGTITINMTTVETIIAIELSQSQWPLGNVTADTAYKTDPEATWCSINNTGTVDVDIRIQGENATEVRTPPSNYHWLLSSDGTNEGHGTDWDEYALWYHMAYDSEGNYTIISTTEDFMKKEGGDKLSLVPGKYKQFGLKLLTPTSLSPDKQMQAHITISAVKAVS